MGSALKADPLPLEGKKRGVGGKSERTEKLLASDLLKPSSPLALPLLTIKTINQQSSK
jgi:hypothetical protein